MAHPPEKRKAVRDAYVTQHLTLEAAAEQSGVAYGTARRWKDSASGTADDWDKCRGAAILAGGGIEALAAKNLSAMLQAHSRGLEKLETETINSTEHADVLASLADAMVKGMAAYSRVAPEISQLAVAMRTLELFSAYLAENKKTLLPVFAPLLQDFGAKLPQLLAGKK